MKTAIKLVLIDLLIAQIRAPYPDYDSLYDLFVRHHGKSG